MPKAARDDPQRGARIRALIAQQNLTNAAVVQQIGASESTFYNWLNGRPIHPMYLKALARALGTTPSYIDVGEDVEEPLSGDDLVRSGLDDLAGRISAVERRLEELTGQFSALPDLLTELAALSSELAATTAASAQRPGNGSTRRTRHASDSRSAGDT